MVEKIKASYENARMTLREKRKLRIILKIILAVVSCVVIGILIAYSMKDMDFSTISHITLRWPLVFISLVIFASSAFFKAASFSKGFARGRITFAQASRFTIIGNALGLIMPFKLGEGIRISLYPRDIGVTERGRYFGLALLLDSVILIVFVGIASVISIGNEFYIQDSIKYSSFLLTAFIVLLIVCVVAVLAAIIFKSSRELLLGLFKTGNIKFSMLFSSLTWFTNYVSIVVALCAFSNITVLDGMKIAVPVIIFTNLAMLIPATPGSIGIFEYMVVLAFRANSLTPENGVIAGIILHLIQYLSLLPIAGIIYLKGFISKHASAYRNSRTDKEI